MTQRRPLRFHPSRASRFALRWIVCREPPRAVRCASSSPALPGWPSGLPLARLLLLARPAPPPPPAILLSSTRSPCFAAAAAVSPRLGLPAPPPLLGRPTPPPPPAILLSSARSPCAAAAARHPPPLLGRPAQPAPSARHPPRLGLPAQPAPPALLLLSSVALRSRHSCPPLLPVVAPSSGTWRQRARHCWLIGKMHGRSYRRKLVILKGRAPRSVNLGKLTREEIEKELMSTGLSSEAVLCADLAIWLSLSI
uniref:Uncharacterized protein n=1 Tax=Setaria viridis TaxID=4556 RepID=A0A4U6U323_SETVI|nr:hypothetical protein SEVIR_6G136108v2 [Setaria viridis]